VQRENVIVRPSRDQSGPSSLTPCAGWVIWRSCLPSGSLTKIADVE